MASSHDDIDGEPLTNYDESDLNIESIEEYKNSNRIKWEH